jgi:hypothetical protein
MSPRNVPCAVIFAALAAAGADASAQPWPTLRAGAPLPPWTSGTAAPTPPPAPSAPARVGLAHEDRDPVDRAVSDLVVGRSTAAAARLADLIARRGGGLHGYDTAAVLWRVAAGEMPAARGPRAAAVGELPPPPDEREALERSVDGAVELLVRGDVRAANAWLDAALAVRGGLEEYHPLRVLLRVARALRGAAASSASRAPSSEGARSEVTLDRARGAIDAGEAVVLYQLGSVYGLALGAWGATATADEAGDASPLASVALPVVGAGAGVVVAALIDGRRDLRRGRAYAANAGFYLGLVGALGVAMLPDGPLRDAQRFEQASALLLAGTVGLGAGVAVAHATDAMPGSASFVLSGGVWGALIGLTLERALSEGGRANGAAGLLVGEAIGAGATMLTARWLRPTPSQTRWLDLGALLGAVTGALLLSQTDNAQTVALASAIGCLGGATLGFVLGAPSDGERELARRLSQRAPRFTPTFTPVAGGGVFGLAL